MEATIAILESSYLIFVNQAYQDCSQPIKGNPTEHETHEIPFMFYLHRKRKKNVF